MAPMIGHSEPIDTDLMARMVLQVAKLATERRLAHSGLPCALDGSRWWVVGVEWNVEENSLLFAVGFVCFFRHRRSNFIKGGTNDRHYVLAMIAADSQMTHKLQDALPLVVLACAERHNAPDHAVYDAIHHTRWVA